MAAKKKSDAGPMREILMAGGYAPPDRHMPVRKGEKYCSPACGFGCTWASYQRAVEESEALARRLGKGWVSHLWENGTWYWSVKDSTGLLDLHQHGKRLFRVYAWRLIGTSANFVVEGTTPEKAVAAALLRVGEESEYMRVLLDQLEASCADILGTKKRSARRHG